MRILYAVLCEHAEVRRDGRVDVHGMFQQLYAPGFPAKQDQMVLALAIEWDVENVGRRDFRIDLIDPNRSPCLTISGHTDVTERRPREAPPQTRLILPLDEVVFPAEGTYRFEMEIGEEKVELAPLHLTKAAG